ncbi:alpha/beta hydrolase [Lacinutrix sp. Bg11-31]|uniref:alpha/beta hydrolase n=1 Tax=Lacinutrix sp. Bg11-31 TaxID=2057808 RepID=UPI000C308852|nr:alpha/beta hydrolase-fold protein [Lacinutrix sp. Bg11-31]AUC81523.1 esterase [Lacinutrix sp. Bg11-31]
MKNTFCIILLSLIVTGCIETTTVQDVIPNHDTFTIESSEVAEARVITVWKPADYFKTTDSLPVIYMLDGGVKEDFPHIANTISKLVESKSIPPIILVGIENTERRRDLTGASQIKEDEGIAPLTDGASRFRKFVSDELFLEINKRYRTTDYKGVIGESVAGLFVVETLLLKPEMFNFYIAMDPSLWWNNALITKTSKDYLSQFPETKQKFWFAGSNAEDISIYTNRLAKTLETNAPSTLTWTYSDEPNEKHNTIFRATKEKALIWALN